MTITLTLPYPPTVNGMYENRRQKNAAGKWFVGRMLSAEAHDFRRTVIYEVRRQRGASAPMLLDECEVSIDLHAPDARRRDADNPVKGIFDAMTHAKVWRDDVQVKIYHVRWCAPCPRGKTVITIRAINSLFAELPS